MCAQMCVQMRIQMRVYRCACRHVSVRGRARTNEVHFQHFVSGVHHHHHGRTGTLHDRCDSRHGSAARDRHGLASDPHCRDHCGAEMAPWFTKDSDRPADRPERILRLVENRMCQTVDLRLEPRVVEAYRAVLDRNRGRGP